MVTLQLVIRAGEADSPPDRPGLAALTARMIGKGTRQLSDEYIESMIESLGAGFKASVFMDYTVLTVDVLAEYLDRAVYVLRLIALEATFGERELGAVRRAAFWELYESKKDPEVLGWRQLLAVLFENHPYRLATHNEDVIKFITPRDVADFYDRFYRPANAAVLVSGDIDGPAIALKIGSHFSAWSGAAPAERRPLPPAANDRERICYVEAPEVGAATIFAGNVIMGSSAADFFPFLVLKQILGGTTGSRLFMSLRETKGLATFAFSEMEVFRSCGVYLGPGPGPARSDRPGPPGNGARDRRPGRRSSPAVRGRGGQILPHRQPALALRVRGGIRRMDGPLCRARPRSGPVGRGDRGDQAGQRRNGRRDGPEVPRRPGRS